MFGIIRRLLGLSTAEETHDCNCDPVEDAPYVAPFPHCDSNVLHSPGTCEYCDHYPEAQNARRISGINFTNTDTPGFLPCPSTAFRTVQSIERWPGNRATLGFKSRADQHIMASVEDALDESDRAATKHGAYDMHPRRSLDRWFNILGEEYGEANKEVVEIGHFTEAEEEVPAENYTLLYKELMQTAAMALKNMAVLRWKGLVR